MFKSSIQHLIHYWRRYTLALAALFALVFVSLRLEENFPFSHFPMYGNPRADDVDYYFLTDAKGNPLSTNDYAGITAPQIKKRFTTLLKKAKTRLNYKKNVDVPKEVRNELALEVLTKVRNDAVALGAAKRLLPWPAEVKIVKGLISTTPNGFRESFRVMASITTEPAAGAPAAVVQPPAASPEPAPVLETAETDAEAEETPEAPVAGARPPANTTNGMILHVVDFLKYYAIAFGMLIVLFLSWNRIPAKHRAWLREGTGFFSIGRLEAFFIRFSLAYIMYQAMSNVVQYTSLPHPQGLAHWEIFRPAVLWCGVPENWSMVLTWSVPLLAWYVIGWGNFIPLTILTLAHILLRTLYASQGAPHHGHQLVSLVFLAQTIIAWVMFISRRCKARGDWAKSGNESIPWLYMAVIIGAAYVITAFEKWSESDGKWITNAHYFSNQIVKTHRQNYYNDLHPMFTEGVPPVPQDQPDPEFDRYRLPVPEQAHWMLTNPTISKIFFSLGFIMEFTAFLLILHRVLAALFGVLIIAFHFLVLWLMHLTFPLNVEVVLVICVNLTGWLIWWRFRKELPAESTPSAPDPA